MTNTRLWDKLGKTDPSNTKSFKRAGGFSGTAIKPMWSFKRMTEEFGPCGLGWGVDEPSFQTVQGHNSEVLVYCTVSVWYKEADQGSQRVFGVGGDKVITHIKANEQYNRPERWENDDEAFKKAYTDAIGNALKLIGVGADVHMGLFDDSKYVREMQEEFSEPTRTPSKAPAKPVEAPKTFAVFGASITSAKTPDDLKDAFAVIWKSSLPQSDKDTLKTAYEAKKAELNYNKTVSGYVAPDFESLQDGHHGDRV